MILWWILGLGFLSSVGGAALAGSFLLFPEKLQRRLIPHLVSYATGTLLGAAFLAMLPHALKEIPAGTALAAVLAGFLTFFVLEKLVIWRHCHDSHCEVHSATGALILLGDSLHNLVDGIILAAAFLSSVPLGILTFLAILAHEIPQELGDVAILVQSGYSRGRALLYNLLASLPTLVGALLAYTFLNTVQSFTPHVMAFSAASFIYIASADLIPGLHRQTGLADAARQLLLILAGIATIILAHRLAG
jgi:zinc and cadmium transporter